MLLRWPATAAGWQLQDVDAFFPGVVWQPEPTPPLLSNSLYQLTLPATNARVTVAFGALHHLSFGGCPADAPPYRALTVVEVQAIYQTGREGKG